MPPAAERGISRLAVRRKSRSHHHLGALEQRRVRRPHCQKRDEQPQPLFLWRSGGLVVCQRGRPCTSRTWFPPSAPRPSLLQGIGPRRSKLRIRCRALAGVLAHPARWPGDLPLHRSLWLHGPADTALWRQLRARPRHIYPHLPSIENGLTVCQLHPSLARHTAFPIRARPLDE